MNEQIMGLFSISSLVDTGEFRGDYFEDEKIDDCLMDMYFYMMYVSIGDKRSEEYFREYERKFSELTAEQQEYVKADYLNILESRNANSHNCK